MVELENSFVKIRTSLHFAALLLVFIFNGAGTAAQNTLPAGAVRVDSVMRDSVRQTDSLPVQTDSAAIKNMLLTRQILQKHPYFNFTEAAQPQPYQRKKETPGKDIYFYIIAALLIVFAWFRTAFAKYFSDLMALFFRRSLKQRQLKQQVSQNSLPSLLFNILYVAVAGFYIALLVNEFGNTSFPFWQLYLYSTALVSITYLVKFLVLKLTGWMFRLKNLTDSYIFIVFLVNKIIGIALLPVVLIVALSNIELKTIVLTLSWVVLGGLFIYRFVQAFGLLRKEKSIGIFHFILYLLALEVLPILVIYKAISHYL